MPKTLEHIIAGLKCTVKGDNTMTVNRIVFDSRSVEKGDLFAAVRGTQVDGHKFIPMAIEKGAAVILCEHFDSYITAEITVVIVGDSATALGVAAANFYDNPSRKLRLMGVTGTNGKTSKATLSHRLFSEFGFKCGLLSTVRNLVGTKELAATHTTPDAVAIQSLMNDMVEAGCDYVFMEVSSHAADQKRIAGLEFDIAIFTNLTHDHLDYHKTFDAYLKAKKSFFDALPKTAFALINTDDKNGRVMVQNTLAALKTYGLHSMTDFKGKVIESHFDGMLMNINGVELWTKLIGEFNAYNLLAVYATGVLFGLSQEDVLRVLSNISTVEGRFEYIRSNTGVTAIIDYAHTPDALKNVISTINQIRSGAGQLITVVGAGGDRDRTKRPVMGKIAAEFSTRVIFTSDNPRSEDPQEIINEMLSGVETDKRKNVLAITDRREAIRTACMLATGGDVILVAGKGHETYQEIKGKRNYFNDKQVVSEIFMVSNINLQ